MASIVNADNGVISGAAGLKLSSDTTGILNLQTNGTTAISISASQVVSFPATTTLDFSGTVTLSGGTANGVTYLNGSKALTSGSALTFDGANLGVGTASPAVKLDVAGASTTQARIQMSGQADVRLISDTGTGITGTYSNHPFTIKTNSADVLTATAAGNVGIGTTSPASKLHVDSSATNTAITVESDLDGGSLFTSGLNLLRSGVAAGSRIQSLRDAGAGGVGLNFLTTADNAAEVAGTLTSRMVIDRSGNLGIGTSSPGAKAEIYVTRTSSTNAVSLILNDNVTGIQTNGVYKAIRSVSNGGGAVSEIRFMETDGTNNNTSISFATQSTANALTERLRIDQNGNLGLGVTPSAWDTSNSIRVLQFRAGSVWSFSTTAMIYAQNSFSNSSGIRTYVNNGYAAEYEQANGQHIWKTAASGTAGNAITFTQAMTLNASGILLLNANAPVVSGAKIHVADTVDTSIQLTKSGSTAARVKIVSAAMAFGVDTADGDTERARITSAGDLLVGTTTTSGKVSVFNSSSDASQSCFQVQNNKNFAGIQGINITSGNIFNDTGHEFLSCNDLAGGGATRMTVRSNGGIANYQANNVNLSDARTKKDIKPLGSMWDKFKAIEIVTFKYNDQSHDDDNIGVIAQQVESVAPEFIDIDGFGETPEDGVPLKTVYTTDMYHAAIKALQEAMARIESLEAKVAALEAK